LLYLVYVLEVAFTEDCWTRHHHTLVKDDHAAMAEEAMPAGDNPCAATVGRSYAATAGASCAATAEEARS
jgi:hypothetical protein